MYGLLTDFKQTWQTLKFIDITSNSIKKGATASNHYYPKHNSNYQDSYILNIFIITCGHVMNACEYEYNSVWAVLEKSRSICQTMRLINISLKKRTFMLNFMYYEAYWNSHVTLKKYILTRHKNTKSL